MGKNIQEGRRMCNVFLAYVCVKKCHFLNNLGMFAQGEQRFKPVVVKNHHIIAPVDNHKESSNTLSTGAR